MHGIVRGRAARPRLEVEPGRDNLPGRAPAFQHPFRLRRAGSEYGEEAGWAIQSTGRAVQTGGGELRCQQPGAGGLSRVQGFRFTAELQTQASRLRRGKPQCVFDRLGIQPQQERRSRRGA